MTTVNHTHICRQFSLHTIPYITIIYIYNTPYSAAILYCVKCIMEEVLARLHLLNALAKVT